MKKKYLGYALISIPFIAYYIFGVIWIGWLVPTISYFITITVFAAIFFGVKWSFEK